MSVLSRLPVSLLAFPLVAALYGLQAFALTGVFLMMMGAALWTGMLVNAGMLGLLVEVPLRRFAFKYAHTYLFWLILPFAYFGSYGMSAFGDHKALLKLRTEYDAANANVSIPFDPERHSLLFLRGAQDYAGTFTQDYGLPIAYSQIEGETGGYLSTRLMKKEFCARVREDPTARAASIHAFGFHDGDRIGHRRMETRFCSLRMPAAPQKEIVAVGTVETETSIDGLPVKLIENVVTMPDGSEFVLRGGVAAPRPWFPVPILGCALNSGNASWDCYRGFSRDGFTTIVSSDTRYEGDAKVLARALGLERISPANRKAVNSEIVEQTLQQAVERQLEQDIADLREGVADPASQMTVHSIRVLSQSPDALLPLAPVVVEGITRAARPSDNPYRNRETGRTLAKLFGKLPISVQEDYADQITSLYDLADAANDGRHWLYEADALLRFRSPAIREPEGRP